MQAFVFSLARMRGYKEQLLDKEKNTLARLHRKRDEIQLEIEQLERCRAEQSAQMQAKQRAGMDAAGLSSYRFLMENSRLQLEDLRASLVRAQAEAQGQLKIVIAASQELSALDKLEEKQREEYRLLEKKESEEAVLEYVTGTLARQNS